MVVLLPVMSDTSGRGNFSLLFFSMIFGQLYLHPEDIIGIKNISVSIII